jgi:riboflavin biosynthesis pyrimidine reductase
MDVVWYTGMSMDGRISSADDSLDFLDAVTGSDPDDFSTFIAHIDAVLVGAGTLRWLVSGGHGWPHDDLPTWLVSHDEVLAQSVRPTRTPLTRVSGGLGPVLDAIEAAGHRRVWLAGGGSIAGQVLRLDRLDEVIVTIAPTVLGSGPALFDGSALPLHRFELVECRQVGTAARLRWVRLR